jgi:hypothetical protein
MRATLARGDDGVFLARPVGSQDSSLVKTLARAEALIVRAPHAPPAEAGAPCRIIRFAALGAERGAADATVEPAKGGAVFRREGLFSTACVTFFRRPVAGRGLVGIGALRACHVWTAPLVKGFFAALRTSRVRSCLRPVYAV